MTFATIDALRASLAQVGPSVRTPAYTAKMLHDLPDGRVVDRKAFILERCVGKSILEFGASGPLADSIRAVAAAYLGVDRLEGDRVVAFDLDDVRRTDLPMPETLDLVVCGEVLEHLANPGWFLSRLRQIIRVPVVITVPNAFSSIAQAHLKEGRENCNKDHVAWYSPRTLQTLLERYGFTIDTWGWYHGEPGTAEGLIVVAQ